MSARSPFATRADIERRHPRELAVLAADETTRLVDGERVDAALVDVSTEIRAILASRYPADALDQLDEESRGVLRLYAIDMALYRVSLSFGRQTETIKARYDAAVRRLEGIAAGRGALTVLGDGDPPVAGEPAGPASPNEVLVSAPERLFTRRRFGGAK